MGNKADSSTSAALQDYFDEPRHAPARRSNAERRDERARAHYNARNTLSHAQEPRRLHGGHARAPQGGRLFQRGHRLRHHQPDDEPLRVGRPARRSRTSSPRRRAQRQHLRRRSARPDHRDGRRHRDRRPSPTTTRSARRACMDELRLAAGQPARAVATRPAASPSLNQNDFRDALLAHPRRTTAATTCSATTRRTTSATAGSGTSRSSCSSPGLKVRARKGYVGAVPAKPEKPPKGSPAERTSPELRDALDSPIAISGLTISAFAAPFKGAAPNDAIALAIEIDGCTLQFTQTPEGLFTNDLEIALFASDSRPGKIKDGARDVINSEAQAADPRAVVSQGMLPHRPPHPDSAGQVPAAHRRARGGRRHGSARCSTISTRPDFSQGPLTMSGIAHHLRARRAAFRPRAPTRA